MAGREVREYTNLTDPKDKKWGGKGKERIDDEELAFQRMVAKGSSLLSGMANIRLRCKRLQENVVAIFTGEEIICAALDSDDLLYLKEQMEAEEDAERLLRRTEKRAFAAFKKAVADTSQAPIPLPLRVEPKAKSGIRQQDLLKRVVEVKPKRQKHSNSSEGNHPPSSFSSSNGNNGPNDYNKKSDTKVALTQAPERAHSPLRAKTVSSNESKIEENPVKSLLSAYESSDDEED